MVLSLRAIWLQMKTTCIYPGISVIREEVTPLPLNQSPPSQKILEIKRFLFHHVKWPVYV